MIDHHVHSSFSGDCSFDMDEMCRAAIKRGVKELCFTDHLDIDCPDTEILLEVDFPRYHQKLEEMRVKYPSLIIRKGVEAGFQSHTTESTIERIKDQDLDFVIASIHLVDGVDPYNLAYYEGKSKNEAYLRYMEVTLEVMKKIDHYSVMGHLGYVTKFAPYEDVTLSYDLYRDYIDAILQRVISTGHGMEINTSGYRNSPTPIPNLEIIRRYKELGGEIITLGSDAHNPEHIAFCFEDAKEMLISMGFQYLATFKEMKPHFVRI